MVHNDADVCPPNFSLRVCLLEKQSSAVETSKHSHTNDLPSLEALGNASFRLLFCTCLLCAGLTVSREVLTQLGGQLHEGPTKVMQNYQPTV